MLFFTILAVLFSLSLLVFFHELGHFIFSKIFNVDVEEFGFGYPPRIFGIVRVGKKLKFFFGKKVPQGEKKGTIYSFNWIPFGGFNRIKSEFGEKQNEPGSFSAKPWWQKSIIALGGVFFNIVLTILLLTLVFSLGSYQILPEAQSISAHDISFQVVEVVNNSPADQAGLKVGDMILAIDQKKAEEIENLQTYVRNKLGVPLKLIVKRGGKFIETKVIPVEASKVFPDKNLTGAVIGISFIKVGRISYSPFIAFWQAIKKTGSLFYQIFLTIISILKGLLIGKKMTVEVVGVVGLAAMTGKVAQMGIIYLLQFMAIVSLLIAFTQLIPFPAIDGGRIIFFIIEGIRKKPISHKVEAIVNNIGFILLIILMIFITYRDVVRISSGFFEKVLFK